MVVNETSVRQEIDEALGVISAPGGVPDDCVCIFASGSVIRGWANSGSDIDLYLVTKTPYIGPTLQRVAVQLTLQSIPVQLAAGPRRIDVEYWTEGQVHELLAKFDSDELFPEVETAAPEIRFLERVVQARAVHGNTWLAGTVETLKKSRFIPVYVDRTLNEAENYAEDAVGQLETGDIMSAVMSARFAYERAVDAFLGSRGDVVGGRGKWRARIVKEHNAAPVLSDDFWDVATFRNLNFAAPEIWISQTLKDVQIISASIDL